MISSQRWLDGVVGEFPDVGFVGFVGLVPSSFSKSSEGRDGWEYDVNKKSNEQRPRDAKTVLRGSLITRNVFGFVCFFLE